MTVYELIQKLTQFDANTEVEISVIEAIAKEEAEYGDAVDAEDDIDEYAEDFSVEDYKKYTGKHVVRPNVTLEWEVTGNGEKI